MINESCTHKIALVLYDMIEGIGIQEDKRLSLTLATGG